MTKKSERLFDTGTKPGQKHKQTSPDNGAIPSSNKPVFKKGVAPVFPPKSSKKAKK